MRRIISAESRKKRDKRNQLILGIGLAAIIMFSLVAYPFQTGNSGPNNSNLEYNGFTFVNVNNLWVLEIGSFQFVFRTKPNEAPKIDSEVNFVNSYSNKPLYIESESDIASVGIYNNLNQVTQRIQPACFKKTCEEDVPRKTCEDNFIIISTGAEASIVQEDNCVFITGPEAELISIVDEFLYKILGVE